jgi:hypothetical protein
MSTADANAIRAVSLRAMLEIQDELRDEVGGEWTLVVSRPSQHPLSDFRGSIEVYGRPPGVYGAWLTLRVDFLDRRHSRPQAQTITLFVESTEQPSRANTYIERATLDPLLDDPDNEVEAFVARFGRAFVNLARVWRPTFDR